MAEEAGGAIANCEGSGCGSGCCSISLKKKKIKKLLTAHA
jgi:hypothetical protein